MANNPLQQHFRQPKIYIKLPSNGAYSKPGSFTQDIDSLAVYGMTGMDEIIMKTPDALLTGESVARVIQSCVPGIANAWELTVLDTEVIFAAIRIATYGNAMTVDHTCNKCETENTYDLDLNTIIEYFRTVQYDNKIVLKDIVIRTQPLSYKQSTRFNIKNFELQQKLGQAEKLEGEAQQKIINVLFAELAETQTDLYRSSIESVEVEGAVVTEREYINEWLLNCDKEVYDAIKKQIDKNRDTWAAPKFNVKCGTCSAETKLFVELDQSNFFVAA